jgi:hypothetical protein
MKRSLILDQERPTRLMDGVGQRDSDRAKSEAQAKRVAQQAETPDRGQQAKSPQPAPQESDNALSPESLMGEVPAQPGSPPLTSDLSALYEILRSDRDVKSRRDAATYLLKLIDDGHQVELETVAAFHTSETDITVATALKRVLNKIHIKRNFSKEPTTPYDRKLSPEEKEKLRTEIERLRGLYDQHHGLEGAFDQRYGRLEKIGDGGMAKIFRAIRRKDNHLVAIKFLSLEELSAGADPERLIARFQREGELLTRRLDHPHIVKGYECGEAGVGHFIVLEYVGGGSVESLITGNPLNYAMFRRIALQLCDAVGYIHRQGVIHRDIKPSNVLIERSPTDLKAVHPKNPDRVGSLDVQIGEEDRVSIKLADFGLAKDKKDARLSRIFFSAGTSAYSSPQQIADARDADERDDIFSMGKTFCEMLTGRILKDDEPYHPVVLNDSDRTDAINTLILKCIARERENRWQSIEALEAALRAPQ